MTADSDRRRVRQATWIGVAAAVLGVAVFLAASQSALRPGFPLDDAWIHQTYARNLAERGEWAFVPGQASGGSTAPLWTLVLAIGFGLGADPRTWAYLLGAAALAFSAGAAVRAFRPRSRANGAWLIWLAVLFALEWHLVWAAASGMEVILLVAAVVVVMQMSLPAVRRPLLTGAIVGGAIWIRPDAISLAVIPAMSIAFEAGPGPKVRASRLLRLAAGAALPAVPYLLFNLATAGTLWPSTFYAKQAEYAELRSGPFVSRLLRLAFSPLVGAGVLLLPGVVLAVVSSVRERAWSDLGPLVWAAIYVAVFAALLPVTYQHGRYQIPVIPVILIIGWQGIRQAVRGAAAPAVRVLTRTWAVATVAVTMAFVVIGARAYAADVALIETEMVEPSRWIAAHTEPQALVAAHDIGALGFFGERQVLDLAGLAEADVIPFLRDEARLAEYMTERGADYLMTFPGWYPELVRCAQVVYDSQASFSPRQGGENMRVYRWPPSPLLPSEGCMLYSRSPDGAAFAGDE